MRWQILMTSATSCSIRSTPMPHSVASRWMSSPSSVVSRSSSPAAGSSSNRRGLGGHRPSDTHQPPASVRQLGRTPVEVGFEIELMDGGHGGGGHLRPPRMDEIGEAGGEVAPLGGGLDVLQHGHVVEQLQRLERPAKAGSGSALWPPPADVVPVEQNASRGLVEARDGVDGRGLAGPVGANETDDLAGDHGHGEPVEGDDAPEAHG